MAATPLCVAADLDARFGAANVTGFADDTGAGRDAAALAIIAECIGEGSDESYALLRPGYPSVDTVQTLVANDRLVKGACCRIVFSILAARRPEFLNAEGASLIEQRANTARKLLRDAAKGGELKPVGEDQAGKNAITQTTTNRDKRYLIFQADSDNPRGKGSF